MPNEHWTDEYKTMVKDCENRKSRLNEWEQEFIQSISEQLDQNRNLTAKQTEILDRVWEKATKNG